MFQSIAAKVVGRFVRDERGATMVEYGLLVALVAVVAVVSLTPLGVSLQGLFTNVNGNLP